MTGPLWGGRFERVPAGRLRQFADSLDIDRRLWREDIDATEAHAGSLVGAGVLSQEELEEVRRVLAEARSKFENGAFVFSESDEDVHSAIERFLTQELGSVGAKIHAGRSRNDLVATDLRLWLKRAIPALARSIHELQETLYRLSRDHVGTLIPGYTHLQRAQPVALAHILLAHAFSFARDFERMIAAFRRCDVSALGAAAFAGTGIKIDPKQSAAELGFTKVFDNAADAVSSRDFALEFLCASAIAMVNLSRLGEELVLWTSKEFGFASLQDDYATGSSIMPQKKNPDVAELVRARSARATANLMHLLGVMKGLPLTYNRDMQEDKHPVFDSADLLRGALVVMTGALQTISFHRESMEASISRDSLATDLADDLVNAGIPFREAHEAIGKLIALDPDLALRDENQLRRIHPALSAEMLERLSPTSSVAARVSHGGTAPERIADQLMRIEAIMDDEERWLAGFGAY